MATATVSASTVMATLAATVTARPTDPRPAADRRLRRPIGDVLGERHADADAAAPAHADAQRAGPDLGIQRPLSVAVTTTSPVAGPQPPPAAGPGAHVGAPVDRRPGVVGAVVRRGGHGDRDVHRDPLTGAADPDAGRDRQRVRASGVPELPAVGGHRDVPRCGDRAPLMAALTMSRLSFSADAPAPVRVTAKLPPAAMLMDSETATTVASIGTSEPAAMLRRS